MMALRTIAVLLVACSAVVTPIRDTPASAASDNLYLKGDSEPSASMGPTPPAGGTLPNFDPGRDSAPGLLISKGDEGAGQTDPTKYQEWRFDVSNKTLSVQSIRIWAAPKDFADDKTVRFAAHVMECTPSCSVLDSVAAEIEDEDGSDWKEFSLPLTVASRSFGAGSHLVVKVTVEDSSDDDMWFAYGTTSFDAHLQVEFQIPIGTTSTTSPSTTSTAPPPTTTTTQPEPTTTSTAPAPTTNDAPTTTVAAPTTSAPTTTTTGGSEMLPVLLSEVAVDARAARPAMLRPEEGLAVVFATVTENISLYWQAALGTGGVASVVLWLGFARREEVPEPDDSADS